MHHNGTLKTWLTRALKVVAFVIRPRVFFLVATAASIVLLLSSFFTQIESDELRKRISTSCIAALFFGGMSLLAWTKPAVRSWRWASPPLVGALVLWLAAGGLGYVEIRIAQVVLACTGIVGFTIACFLAWMSPLEPDLSELRMDTSCTNKKMRKKRFLRWPAPKEIAARLACLDESPNLWHWLVDDLGTESARLYISSLEESAALANTWYPKLKQLEEQCRAENPLPSIGDFTPAERAQYDLYCQKIGEDERPRRNAYDALFFSLPPVGLVAAADLWPGREERTVFLTPSEWQKWHGIYEHPDEAFWWFTNYHWEIKTSPSPEDFSFSPEGQADVLANHILPENAVWWVFQHGMAWGSLAGSYQAELWAWDGTHATFVDDLWLAVS